MSASVLAAPVQYTALKNQAVTLVPTIADITAPTRLELNAGVDITLHIPGDGISGFVPEISAGDASYDPETGVGYAIAGGVTYGQASIACLQSKTGPAYDVRSVVSVGDLTHVVIFDPADVAGNRMDVFEVRLNAIAKGRQRGSAKQLTLLLSISAAATDVVVPA